MTTVLVDEADYPIGIEGITKSFGAVDVLRGVDLELRPGEIMGLVGRNGVGKSTLAAVLAGTLQADAGVAQYAGTPLEPWQVSIIEQQLRLDPTMSVAEALFRQSEVQHLPDAEVQAAARRALIEAGIALDPEDRLGDLQESDRRLVEVVRLLADPRRLMIIDEVSTTFNARETEDLRFAARRATGGHRSILFITHRLEEALELCDRVAVMRDGLVVEVVSSLTATPESLSEAMFGRVVELRPRNAQVSKKNLLSVTGLDAGGALPVSFDLHEGEVLGLCGARDSGVDTLIHALTGDAPRVVGSIALGGEQVTIASPRDASRLRLGVLAGAADQGSDTYFARNLMMLDDPSEEDYDANVEDTAAILLAFREADAHASKLFNRPALSVGQRRWRQLRELAAEHSRLLILIEPTRGMDLSAREEFTALLDEVTGRGVGVLLLASDEAELHLLSDRLLVMAHGQVEAEWNPIDVSVEQLAEVTRGDWPPAV
ncbi:MAG: ATP-binding cassette domain-containing protein [Propioniciclava sp.]|jgi:ribose transport system ATP-binding protein